MRWLRSLLLLSLVIISGESIAREICRWGSTTYIGGVPFDSTTASGACIALAKELNKGQPVEANKWVYDRAEIKDNPGSSYKRKALCYGRTEVFTTAQYYGEVLEQCTNTDQVCEKGKTDSFIFQWLKNKSDDYNVYIVPRYISIDGCEYKRQDESVAFGNKGQCKYPATIDYRATGDERDDPKISNAVESFDPEDHDNPPTDDDPPSGEMGKFPNIKNLYQPKYPGGILSVMQGLWTKVQDTQFVAAARALMPSLGQVGGNCGWATNISFDMGSIGFYGDHVLSVSCDTMKIIKALFIFGALVLARGLIFGG